MKKKIFDLHCHSTYSDGTLTPKELVRLADSLQIDAIAVCDHDACMPYDELIQERAFFKTKVLSGVELSTDIDGENIHILGYAFDPDNEEFIAFCKRQREKRIDRNKAIIEKLQKKGFSISEEDVYGTKHALQSYGRPHIASALVKKGYIKDVKEAFYRYIGLNKSCYVSGEHSSVQEAIAIIHKAHGKAVLAHPHIIRNKKIVTKLLEFPFDGIEAHYGILAETTSKRWKEEAQKRGWFVTGGSDFHGDVKPEIALGANSADEEVFSFLSDHFMKIAPHYAMLVQ